jgi:hypothetical protein
MSLIGPVGAVSSSHLALEASVIHRFAQPDPLRGIAPFWRDLHGSLVAAGSDEARFRLLARLAAENGALPALPDAEPPPITLRMDENALRHWADGQTPTVRGRFRRLAQGANIAARWPWHALQGGGRFSAHWKRAMCRAARRYVEALAADADALALLLQPLEQLPANRRYALIDRLCGHACAAWEIAPPRLQLHAHDRDDCHGRVLQAAQARFGSEGRIEFFPWAFTQGPIELIATVFHEATHLLQMYRLAEDGVRRGLLSRHACDAIDAFHAEILQLSFDYSAALDTRRYGNYYYLYRFETEVEREAHLAGMEAALLAAARPEFNPAQTGTMAAVLRQATPARARIADYDPNLVAQSYVERETGLRIDELPALAAGAADDDAPRRMATLQALQRRVIVGGVLRLAALTPGAGVSPAPLALLRRRSGLRRADPPAPPATAWIWNALQKLEGLRDRLDRSGLLAQAILCCAPKALYGVSEESRFLRALFNCALDPDGSPLAEFLRQHLERHLGCGGRDANGLAAALRAARVRYRSPLSRRILLEAACSLTDDASSRAMLARALGTSG